MYEFKYDIKLNDKGRPYIDIPDNYKNDIEDRFMALEICRYVLYDIAQNKNNTLPDDFIIEIAKSGEILETLSNSVAALLKGQMEAMGTLNLNSPIEYDVRKTTIEERDNIKYGGFIYGGKILERKEGFKVLVLSVNKVYELVGGIDNKHWTEVKRNDI